MKLKNIGKFKKMLAGFVVIFSMLINMMSSTLVFADTLNYPKSLEKMKQLGVFDNSVGDKNSAFTESQMMRALAVADGLSDTASSSRGETIFPDVESNSELSGYVNAVVAQGFFNGTEDGYLHGDNGVTYEQLCIMLVRLLGYSKTDLKGSYPNNYINKAVDLKLTYNIGFKKENTVPIWAAVVMFDRVLDTDIKGTPAQTLAKSVNLFDDYVIQDNSVTSTNLTDNDVLTDKGILYLPDSNTKLSVGSTYRLCTDNNNITKVYGTINEAKSIIVDSAADDTVNYLEDNSVKNMVLPSAPVYYYHGVKQDYKNVSSILKKDMKIVFTYNEDKTSFDHAVIIDPLYSTPVIASNFDSSSSSIGDITFDDNIAITQNGKTISKNDIEDMDAVYNVTDIDGKNRFIQIVDDRVEGNITSFTSNGNSTTGIQIDNVSYNFSKDMDFSNISSFKNGDLISAVEGYDGKIISLDSIDHKRGKLVQGIVVGNSKTTDGLGDNQVLVSQIGSTVKAVIYNCLKDLGELTIGEEYSFYADNTTITNVQKKVNSVENYAVSGISDGNISYLDDNNIGKNVALPQVSDYYYHGEKVDYSTAINSVQPYSSIILGRNNENTGYSYAVIVDPCYGKPDIYKVSNVELMTKFEKTKYDYIVRKGAYIAAPTNLQLYDAVYFVSDLWNKATYVYVNDATVTGTITDLKPNRITPNTIQINNVNYTLSQYFDRSRLMDNNNQMYVGTMVTLILGVDGEVVAVY